MSKSSQSTNRSGRWSRFVEESSFLRHYLWKYRAWVGIGLIALIIVDALEVLPPILLKEVVDVIVDHRSLKILIWIALTYLSISLVQGVCRYSWRMFLIRSGIFTGRDLREKYTHHLFNLSISFFDRAQMGSLMSLATSDVEAVRIAVGTGLLVLADALIYLLTIPFAMFFLSPQLTLLVCLPLPIIPFIVLKNEKAIHTRFEKVQECFSEISAITQENLNGIRVVKGFAREDTQIQRIKEAGQRYVQLNLSLAKIQTAIGPTLDLIMSMGMMILLFWGGSYLIQQGEAVITLGTFVAFQRYIQKMIWPMTAVGMAVNYYQRSVSSSGRLKGVLNAISDVPNTANLAPYSTQSQGKIEFKNMNFKFPGSQNLVLKEINLKILPGEKVAFVGSIGAGKSAILSLLPRLYPIQKGMLLVDDLDINDWSLDELRKHIGYVSQEVFLFSETIFENLAFGIHEWADQSGHLKMIQEAATVAGIHNEVMEFDLAYKTRLGERGINLSGGQKQRLTIARALVKEPSILVLDDALSSVDVQTEEKILQSLRARPGRNTEVISAHRISTIINSDRIIVLREGRVIQVGSHSQLIKNRDGDYWKFYEQQQLKEDLEYYQNELC